MLDLTVTEVYNGSTLSVMFPFRQILYRHLSLEIFNLIKHIPGEYSLFSIEIKKKLKILINSLIFVAIRLFGFTNSK